MRQGWRWFGPSDSVTVDEMLQAGVESVVAALLHVPAGEVWTSGEIDDLKSRIAQRGDGTPSGLEWEVVESLPVSEDIKRQSGKWREHISNYRQSLDNLAASGLTTVCYNFMPLLDWTRTDVAWRLPHGGACMRFDFVDFAAFDIHILRRAGARESYPEPVATEAEQRFGAMDEATRARLVGSILHGLPNEAVTLTTEAVREQLDTYATISQDRLRANMAVFLEEVAPHAEKLGVRLCCHPDDPPFTLLGLPRIVSTEDDLRRMTEMVDLPANGITLCSGSLGGRGDNDIPGIMKRLGSRVHFLHLRNVRRDTSATIGSFYEAEHLNGDVDMVALIANVLREEARRRAKGREDANIVMRPDHGQDILDDLNRHAQPGYPAIGRLRGLAELRGVMTALA